MSQTPPRSFTPVKRVNVNPPGSAIINVDESEGTRRELIIDDVHTELYTNDALPGLSIHEPTAILLDVNNLFQRARDNNFRIDYLKLRELFQYRCNLRYCAAFSAVDREDDAARRWLKYMTDIAGFTVFSKDLYRYTSDEGKQVVKGNLDVELTIGAMKLSPSFTHVIIGTCDGDFTGLVEELKADPVRKVSVIGISSPEGGGINRNLIKACDNFYDLSKLRDFVSFNREQ